jgi:cyclopropane fatty-acyl-phospholipid synthase-like methyltransferase
MASNLFREFWEHKSTPLHGKDENNYFKNLSNEINFILEQNNYNKEGNVFEIGCGDGSNFDYLEINKEKYEGVDFSQTMIDIFKNNHPNLSLKVGDETILYNSDRKYSLIFGIGVHQFFSKNDLEIFIKNSLLKLENDGIIILGFLLSSEQKRNFYFNKYGNNNSSLLLNLKAAFHYCKLSTNSKLFGFWYSANYFNKASKKLNFEYKIYNSMLRPYRFSVCIKKNN